MGSGKWSTDVYSKRAKARAASGKSAFDYSDSARRSGKMKAHPSLDPQGLTFRESRDSKEHPASNSIIVLFDVTGSMRTIPQELQKDLPQLLGLLLYKDYIPHPQILFGAIGDAYSDRVPLQVGQFESDNRMDENLQNIVLEGGGGGQGKESYDLGMYFAARHTKMDCYDKRGKKAYLFMIGDEKAYPHVSKDQVNALIGSGLEGDIPLPDIINEVKEKFNFFFIVPTDASYGRNKDQYEYWKELLGQQHVIPMERASDIAEIIALTIGTMEGTIGLDDGIEDLREHGIDSDTIDSVKKSLAVLPGSGSSVVKGDGGSLDLDDPGNGGSQRL